MYKIIAAAHESDHDVYPDATYPAETQEVITDDPVKWVEEHEWYQIVNVIHEGGAVFRHDEFYAYNILTERKADVISAISEALEYVSRGRESDYCRELSLYYEDGKIRWEVSPGLSFREDGVIFGLYGGHILTNYDPEYDYPEDYGPEYEYNELVGDIIRDWMRSDVMLDFELQEFVRDMEED